MQKIPTIFQRDPKTFKVIDEPTPGCEWVFDGQGIVTEKIDGTNVQLTVKSGTIAVLEKRRNPSKKQKADGIVDPWYVTATVTDPADKWIFAASVNTDVSGWPDGEHPCEAIGPKIQGNPLGLESHICYAFTLSPLDYGFMSRDFVYLSWFLRDLDSLYSPGHLAEGIVFHHPDGRMAKIKRKDFTRQ